MVILVTAVQVAFEVLNWLIIARVLLSFLPNMANNTLVRFIFEITEPVLVPFRRLIPRGSMPLDFSPLIAIIVLQFVERLVLSLLWRL